jgi:two-component system, NtrC family, sensor kinase
MPSEVSTVGGDQSVEELRRELDEAHRREAATAEVLRVISRSVSEAKPVFDIIAGSALRLVNAQYVGVTLYDED